MEKPTYGKLKKAVFLGTFVTQLGIRSTGPFGDHLCIRVSFLVGLITKLSTVVKDKLSPVLQGSRWNTEQCSKESGP